MEDQIDYHFKWLMKLIANNMHLLPESEKNNLNSCANAFYKAVEEDRVRRKEFARNVKEMRISQKNYFKASKEKQFNIMSEWMKKSRHLEGLVDQRAVEIIEGVKQQDLFA